ncbi:hypothetical protein [Aquiflexum sp.]|uniref:hypothetical protein n=1 Tax=Aquiflexum sp. TaxID=1872584 RepID=UPI0035943087
MKKSLFGLIVLLILTNSCAIFQKTGPSVDVYEGYQEDLSEKRITFPSLEKQVAETVKPRVTSTEVLAVDGDLEIALRNFTEKNRSERYWSGFTVMVYSGVDRDMAFKTRNDLFMNFPDIKTDMQYQQPRYLVKVGKYVNRIEAQAHYHKIKDRFPTARIIQDRFQREGYVNPEPIDNGERQN